MDGEDAAAAPGPNGIVEVAAPAGAHEAGRLPGVGEKGPSVATVAALPLAARVFAT